MKTHPRLEILQADLGNEKCFALCVVKRISVPFGSCRGVALIAARPTETIHRNIYPTQLLLEALQEEKSLVMKFRYFWQVPVRSMGRIPSRYGAKRMTWYSEQQLSRDGAMEPAKAIDEFLALACVREKQLPDVIGRFFLTS